MIFKKNFLKLFIFIINQRHTIHYFIVCSVGHVTLKKVISYITSYFSKILTELHRYKRNELPGKLTVTFKIKKLLQICQITWMPQYYVK